MSARWAVVALRSLEYAGIVATRDIPNLWRYGKHAPLWAQRIWISPCAVKRAVFGYRNGCSGEVLSGWDAELADLARLPKIRASISHWGEGKSWAQTGVYDYLEALIAEHGKYDGCKTRRELEARYRRIDLTFEQVCKERRLKTRREVTGRTAFREVGGIRIHIGRGCEPVFAGGGHHRLAMAQILALPSIPSQIGVVHPSVITEWKATLRRPR